WHPQPRHSNSDLLKATVNLENRHATLSTFDVERQLGMPERCGSSPRIVVWRELNFSRRLSQIPVSESLRQHRRVRGYFSHRKREIGGRSCLRIIRVCIHWLATGKLRERLRRTA